MQAQPLTYDDGLADGRRMAVNLIRAGASVDAIAALLPGGDPALLDPAGYQDTLRELRRLMKTDELFEGTAAQG